MGVNTHLFPTSLPFLRAVVTAAIALRFTPNTPLRLVIDLSHVDGTAVRKTGVEFFDGTPNGLVFHALQMIQVLFRETVNTSHL
jgi:hypothetical protein